MPFNLTFATPLVLLLLPVVLGWAAWLWLREQGNLSPARHRLALTLRLLILASLILVLAGATWQQPTSRQATIFVADLSASVAGSRDRELSFINRALKARGHDDVAAVVVVGADALVEQPFAALNNLPGFQSVVERDATNLEAGLNLAGALFPTGYRKRVVVLTDGQQNTGDALAATHLLRDEGVRVDIVPEAQAAGPEALVVDVQAPPSLRLSKNARLPLVVDVSSSVAQSAAFDVFDDTQLVAHRSVVLAPGQSSVSFSLPPPGPGFHRLHVQMQPTSDTVYENNSGDAYTRVDGPAQVLVAEGMPGEGNVVAASLRARGMVVKQVDGGQVPANLSDLSRYDAVVLVDVPALYLDPVLLDPQQSPLQSYVDGGNGLVVIGGPNSYGVGGYLGTALDNLLPVSMKLPQRKDMPSVAVALIIEDLETESNVNISKAAGEGVIRLLTPSDRVAVNDATGTDDRTTNGWAVPLQYVINKPAINRAIDAMNPIDPMSYKPALSAAFNVLRPVKAKIKHIILLGDGDATDNYFPLVQQIHKAGITISTVATGAGPGGFGADYGLMQNIARWGGGRYYPADNVNSIPQIFLKETKQIARTGIVEERFVPELVSDSPIIKDLPAVTLGGYVATTPKPAGQQVLVHVTKYGVDPLLAQWQYGLGHVVAWTSDAQGQWTGNLIGNARANLLWANMVSWALPSKSSSNLRLSSTVAGNQAHLTVTTSGLPLDAQISARVDGPTGKSAQVLLQPTAPGQYEADLPLSASGAYLVGLRATVNGHVRASLRTGLVAPYAAEYRTTGLDSRLLNEMAAIGQGTLLADPASSFADNLAPVYAPHLLTVPLLWLALLLLPFDVATRRLLIGMTELRAILAALSRRRRLQPAAATVASAPLSTVRATRAVRRERATVQRPAAPPPAGAPPASPSATPSPPPRPTAVPRPVPEANASAPEAAVARPATPAANDATTTSKLLEAKRRRRSR